MYSTCLFCHRSLGANELVEHFPVGRKLAFDAAKGRLWVVCAACGQWNLTPLEERWEAVEECERIFRDARRRVSTDQIGLARVAERVDLIRIGEPLRPEFAAWRYGERFRARRNRALVAGTAAVTIIAGVTALVGASIIGYGASFAGLYSGLRRAMNRRSELAAAEKTLARIVGGRTGTEGDGIDVHLQRVAEPVGWTLQIVCVDVELNLQGSEALHTAHLILPATNPHGASTRTIRRAVAELEEIGEPERYFSKAIDRARETGLHFRPIRDYPAAVRLALEMAAHEESERRAMHGELSALEDAWREAEEIARIADDMFLPESTSATLERMRRDTVKEIDR